VNAPLLIALPGGLHTSGVVTWALRLSQGLAKQGRRVGIVTHRATGAYTPRKPAPLPGVRFFDASHLPTFEDLAGDLGPINAFYADAVNALSEGTDSPVVIAPNLLGDCYGAAAALTLTMPRRVRLLGWCHLDSNYDRAVLEHFAPALSACVAVSSHIHTTLHDSMARAGVPLAHIPYGVPVSSPRPPRGPRSPGPLRLLYAGRLEEGIKRISALTTLSDSLTHSSVPHELTIIGDGPAAESIARDAHSRPHWTLLPPCTPEDLPAHFSAADVFVLPSRAEGLSIAMLEAMSHACVPLVTRVRSGVTDAVEDGICAFTVDAHGSGHEIGKAMAARLAPFVNEQGIEALAHMGERAAARAQSHFALDAHINACARLIDTCAASAARPWPATRATAYTAPATAGTPGGSVPADAALRMTAALESLAGHRVIIHGAGAHTVALAAVLARFSDRIVGITDDDPSRNGTRLWGWPVCTPQSAPPADAVVISSLIHQEEIASAWAGRNGPRVIRLYPARQRAA
jgi:glycosyltransferase involved in cell wall biosynthesis